MTEVRSTEVCSPTTDEVVSGYLLGFRDPTTGDEVIEFFTQAEIERIIDQGGTSVLAPCLTLMLGDGLGLIDGPVDLHDCVKGGAR